MRYKYAMLNKFIQWKLYATASLRLTVLIFTKIFLLWFCTDKSTSVHKYFTLKLFEYLLAFLNKNHLF